MTIWIACPDIVFNLAQNVQRSWRTLNGSSISPGPPSADTPAHGGRAGAYLAGPSGGRAPLRLLQPTLQDHQSGDQNQPTLRGVGQVFAGDERMTGALLIGITRQALILGGRGESWRLKGSWVEKDKETGDPQNQSSLSYRAPAPWLWRALDNASRSDIFAIRGLPIRCPSAAILPAHLELEVSR